MELISRGDQPLRLINLSYALVSPCCSGRCGLKSAVPPNCHNLASRDILIVVQKP